LENSLTRAALLTKSPVLTKEDILSAISETGLCTMQDASEKTLAEVEKAHILQVLEAKRGHLGFAQK
jgi:two-component system, NtrC family, response regulator AtoC